MRQVMGMIAARLMLSSCVSSSSGYPVGVGRGSGRVERLGHILTLGVSMRTRSVAAVLGALALVAMLGLITPADAGLTEVDNYVVVEKVVDGPVPEGTVFEIEVDCTPSAPVGSPEAEATPSVPDPDPVTLKFDANGDPLGTDMVSAPRYGTCKVTETVDGGASTVSYKCAVPPLASGNAGSQAFESVECIDDQTVGFGQLMAADGTADYEIGAEATVTVTNTFEPEPEPETAPAAAGVVAARPAFTG
jgi:hypothetical protein